MLQCKKLHVILLVYVCSCTSLRHGFSFTYLTSQQTCFCTTIDKFSNLNVIRVKCQYYCTCVSFVIGTLQGVIARLYNKVHIFCMTTFNASLTNITALLPRSRDSTSYISTAVDSFSTSGFQRAAPLKTRPIGSTRDTAVRCFLHPTISQQMQWTWTRKFLCLHCCIRKFLRRKFITSVGFILCFLQDQKWVNPKQPAAVVPFINICASN